MISKTFQEIKSHWDFQQKAVENAFQPETDIPSEAKVLCKYNCCKSINNEREKMMKSQKSKVKSQNYNLKVKKIIVFSFGFEFLLLRFELIKDLDHKIIKPLIYGGEDEYCKGNKRNFTKTKR